MSYDLTLAQSHALQLSRDLMVPVTVFEVDGEYGVLPSAFEQEMIQDELQLYEDLLTKVDSEDRVSRKRLERLKEGLQERLEALATRKDNLLTISEIGVDQIVVDEAQEFRKLSFATNMSTLKGIDPNGSQRAWDLYVKSRYIETKNLGRALVLASGTPITNTLCEMFSIQRLLGYATTVSGSSDRPLSKAKICACS